MELKTEIFIDSSPNLALVKFIKTNHIKKEDILMITQGNGSYTLFYYR